MIRVLHFYGASYSLALFEVDWLLLLEVPSDFIYLYPLLCLQHTQKSLLHTHKHRFHCRLSHFLNTLMFLLLTMLCCLTL